MSDATAVSFRKGNRAEHNNFHGVKGEVTVDTSTPTLWVHIGNDEKGTPLAREDLNNVTSSTILEKGIASNSLENVVISNIERVKNNLAPLDFAYANMNNVNTVNLATSTGHSGNNLAYADGANVNTTLLAEGTTGTRDPSTLGRNLAYADLANVSKSTLEAKLSDFAFKNANNINTTLLAEGAAETRDPTLLGKNLAYADLSNLSTLSGTTQNLLYTNNVQLATYLVQSMDDVTDTKYYPSAVSVRTAINAHALPSLPESSTKAQLYLLGNMLYQYALAIVNGGTGYTANDLISVDNLDVLVLTVDDSGAILTYSTQTKYGRIEKSGEKQATRGTGSGASFTIVSIQVKTDNTEWNESLGLDSSDVTFDNTDEYITEITEVGTIDTVEKALQTLGLTQQTQNKVQILDLSVASGTGVISMTLNRNDVAVENIHIKKVIGGTAIAGTWSGAAEAKTFVPTTATDVLNNSWIVTFS